MRFAKKAGDVIPVSVPTGFGVIELEVVCIPRAVSRQIEGDLERLNAADLPKRSDPERLTPDGASALLELCRTHVHGLVRRVLNVEIGGVDLSSLAPVEWSFRGSSYHGLPPAAVDLLEAADLLEIVTLRALEAQRPSAVQGESSGPPERPCPRTSPCAASDKTEADARSTPRPETGTAATQDRTPARCSPS